MLSFSFFSLLSISSPVPSTVTVKSTISSPVPRSCITDSLSLSIVVHRHHRHRLPYMPCHAMLLPFQRQHTPKQITDGCSTCHLMTCHKVSCPTALCVSVYLLPAHLYVMRCDAMRCDTMQHYSM